MGSNYLFPLVAVLLITEGVSQSLSIQPCIVGFSPESLSYNPSTGVVSDGNGNCVTADTSNNLATSPCISGGSKTQQFAFNPDGTVSSNSNSGVCWNVDGGSVSPGTPVVLYSCGTALAANDIFYPIQAWSVKKEPRIYANESGLCISSVAAPPPPPPNGTCTTDIDCSLNGKCTGGMCSCYPPWTDKPDCSRLSFLPTPVDRGYPNWASGQNETTWGGSIALDPTSGKYHMFVAEMMNDCPLSTWGQNSRCSHAVSDSAIGPYTFSDVSVTNWCHNPAIVLQTKPDGTQLWVLFHIGDGTGGSTKNCSNGQEIDSSGDVTTPTAGSTLHIATSPYGPFTPSQPLPSCNNPAPWLAANGTWFAVCDGFELWRTEDVVSQPWEHVVTIRATGSPISGNYEDPFFFIDARGNWHILYHVYRTGGESAHNCTPGNDGAVVSGHYFSQDGLSWITSPTMPYLNVITLADGTNQLLTTRERPKMIFNSDGEPTHLSNGVCPSPGNWNTPISCPQVQTGCVDCKYNDWDFTNVSPLNI